MKIDVTYVEPCVTKVAITYIESCVPLGTTNGVDYTVIPRP